MSYRITSRDSRIFGFREALALPPLVVAAIISSVWQAPAAAQQAYPVKPVRIISPFPPGGGNIENRPGGGTVIGTEFVARSPGDGHTVLVIGPSFTMLSALRSKLPFDPEKDFKSMGQAIALPMVIKSDGLRYGKIARAANVRLD